MMLALERRKKNAFLPVKISVPSSFFNILNG